MFSVLAGNRGVRESGSGRNAADPRVTTGLKATARVVWGDPWAYAPE